MQTPVNPFKRALTEKRPQIGLWLGLADSYSAEICAGAGFDWLLIDGEHSPNGLRSILQQAQAIAAYPGSHAIARVPVGHGDVGTALIKQYLDLGLQTLLVPMVDTPEQARAIVRAMRYPPDGMRGMGGARASRWGRYPGYAREANAQVCLLLQAETREALRNLEAIASDRRRRRRLHRTGRPVGLAGSPGQRRACRGARRHRRRDRTHPAHRQGGRHPDAR